MRKLIFLVALMLFAGNPGFVYAGSDQNNIMRQDQKPRVGNKQAVSKAKRHYPGSKVLSIKLIDSNGPPVYRIKLLSGEGVVKFVFVDGTNGGVFE